MARPLRNAARTPEWARLARKEQWRRDRAAAPALSTAFPAIEQLRIELSFVDKAVVANPAAQTHVMHPPARAYFEFPCPYANCDGNFNLQPMTQELLDANRAETRGTLECAGVRSRDGVTKPPCGVQMSYEISAQYRVALAARK